MTASSAQRPQAPSLLDLARDPLFRLLWLAMFISSIGSGMMAVALSLELLGQTHSIFRSNLVFVVQALGALALVPVLSWITRQFRTGGILVGAEISGAIATLILGFASGLQLMAALPLLLPRAMASNTTRSVRFAALKEAVAPERLEKATSVFNLCTYLGGGLGLIMVGAVKGWPLWMVASLDAMTFVVSAFLYYRFMRRRQQLAEISSAPNPMTPDSARSHPATPDSTARERRSGNFRHAMAMASQLGLWPLILLLGLTVGLFQSYLAVGREAIPLDRLGLSSTVVMNFMYAQLAGVICGALIVSRFLQLEQPGPAILKRPVVWFVVASLLAALIAFSTTLWQAVAGFVLLTLVFEICFTLLGNRLVLLAPSNAVSMLVLLKNTAGVMLMAMGLISLGAASDSYSFSLVGTVVAVVGVVSALLLLIWSQRNRAAMAGDMADTEML